jgi:hypothetical protein
MDGLARVAGGCGSFLLGGRTRRVGPLRLKHWAEIENHLLFVNPANPLAEMHRVAGKLDDRMRERLTQHVNTDLRSSKARRVVRIDEVMEWISHAAGIGYTAWCCLRDYNRDCESLEETQALLAEEDRRTIIEFVRLRNQISGIDLLASADWPDPEAGVRPERLKRRREQQAKQFVPWRKFYYVTSHNTGLSPESIGEMTLYQAKVYMSRPEDFGAAPTGGGEGGTGVAGEMVPINSRRGG